MPTELNVQLVQVIRTKDVELSEDLNRRMVTFTKVAELNNFFHGTLALYTSNTLQLRGKLLVTEDFQLWLNNFINNILPYMSKKRLPPCTTTTVEPVYTGDSKDSIL